MGIALADDVEAAEAAKPQLRASHEAYQRHVREVMQAADWPWPEDLVCHPSKQPRFVHSVDEFWRELQLGCHLNEIVVFPDGLRQLGQLDAMDSRIAAAAGLVEGDLDRTAYDVLRSLSAEGMLPKLKGKVTFKPDIVSRDEEHAGLSANSCIAPKWEDLQKKCPEFAKTSVYLAEVRLLESVKNDPYGLRSKRKSTMKRTMRECLHQHGKDVRSMLYWDDFSEGVFCGAGCSGYDLHADCIPTSNIGSVFAGHKLLAIWGYPEDTTKVLRDHGREMFTRPLPEKQLRSMQACCAVALAPPGSVYVFSGMNAHAVCNVGFAPPLPGSPPSPSIILSSYEAFASFNFQHAAAMINVCRRQGYDADDFDDLELKEFEEELGDEVVEILKRVEAGETMEHLAAFQKLVTFLSQHSRAFAATLQKAQEDGAKVRSEGDESSEKLQRTE